MAPDSITILPIELQHLNVVATLHYDTLPDDFLPALGLSFLKKAYYPAVVKSPYAKTFIAQDDKQIAGCITIATDGELFIKEVIANNMVKLCLYAMYKAIRSPKFLYLSFELFWSSITGKPDPVKGEIIFIGVNREYQGKGIGKLLVNSALDHLKQNSIKFCRTKTLEKNTNVINMYENMGWKVRDHFSLITRKYVTIVSQEI
jgi:ribosomal protein S18 acetylase RimI-like enzyme